MNVLSSLALLGQNDYHVSLKCHEFVLLLLCNWIIFSIISKPACRFIVLPSRCKTGLPIWDKRGSEKRLGKAITLYLGISTMNKKSFIVHIVNGQTLFTISFEDKFHWRAEFG